MAGVFLLRPQPDICLVRWRVGEIDPRFNVSAYDVHNAASNAAEAWNTATPERVLFYDKSDGIPLNLVFNESHAAMAESIAIVREIRRLAAEIDRLTPQYERTRSPYVAERINRSISEYNRLVVKYNQTSREEINQGSYETQLEVYAFADLEDLKLVIAHEFGHALGIGHVEVPGAVMQSRNMIGSKAPFRLHPADIIALKQSCSI